MTIVHGAMSLSCGELWTNCGHVHPSSLVTTIFGCCVLWCNSVLISQVRTACHPLSGQGQLALTHPKSGLQREITQTTQMFKQCATQNQNVQRKCRDKSTERVCDFVWFSLCPNLGGHSGGIDCLILFKTYVRQLMACNQQETTYDLFFWFMDLMYVLRTSYK